MTVVVMFNTMGLGTDQILIRITFGHILIIYGFNVMILGLIVITSYRTRVGAYTY